MDSRWLMPRLTLAHLEQIAKGPYLRPVLEERGAFQVVGLTTLVKRDRSFIADLWDLLHQELANCAKPVVAGIELTAPLKVGDKIAIKGHTTDLELTVESMQVQNANVQEGKPGDEVGIKVPDRVRRGDYVYKIT